MIQVLKLHEMNVGIERPKLLAARRLGEALKQRQLSISAAEASNTEEGASDTGLTNLPRSKTSSGMVNPVKAPRGNEAGDDPPLGDIPPRLGRHNVCRRRQLRSPLKQNLSQMKGQNYE